MCLPSDLHRCSACLWACASFCVRSNQTNREGFTKTSAWSDFTYDSVRFQINFLLSFTKQTIGGKKKKKGVKRNRRMKSAKSSWVSWPPVQTPSQFLHQPGDHFILVDNVGLFQFAWREFPFLLTSTFVLKGSLRPVRVNRRVLASHEDRPLLPWWQRDRCKGGLFKGDLVAEPQTLLLWLWD